MAGVTCNKQKWQTNQNYDKCRRKDSLQKRIQTNQEE